MSEPDERLSAAGDDDQVDVDDIVRQHENDADSDVEVPRDQAEEPEAPGEDKEGPGAASQKSDPKKRVVRKMVVLNTERLKGRKGVQTIEKLYQGFQFRGKGREKEDLERLMKRLEYWAFRLFPKLEFDDFLDKCEALGHKKDLQTHLKKYRLGMIDANYNDNEDDTARDDEMIQDEGDEDEPTAAAAAAAAAARTERELLDEINDENFERLLAETVNVTAESQPQTST